MRPVSGDIRFVRSYPLASFGHVQNFERTPRDKCELWVNVTHALVCGLSGSRAVCPVLMRSASCMYQLMSVRSELWTFERGQVKEFSRRVQRTHLVFVQRTFCPFLIRYIFVLLCLIITSILVQFWKVRHQHVQNEKCYSSLKKMQNQILTSSKWRPNRF